MNKLLELRCLDVKVRDFLAVITLGLVMETLAVDFITIISTLLVVITRLWPLGANTIQELFQIVTKIILKRPKLSSSCH